MVTKRRYIPTADESFVYITHKYMIINSLGLYFKPGKEMIYTDA